MDAVAELSVIAQVFHTVGVLLWTGGILAQVVLGGWFPVEIRQLGWTLDALGRLAGTLVLPGAGICVASGLLVGAAQGMPTEAWISAKLTLSALGVGAALTAEMMLRKARGLVDAHLEDLKWQREAARALMVWRMLTLLGMGAVTGAVLVGILK
jgi:hypothetical protein